VRRITQARLQGAHQCGLVDVSDFVLLVPLDLIGLFDLRLNLLLELALPLRHTHAQGLSKADYPLLDLGSALFDLPQLDQGLPVDHVGLDVGVVQLDGPEGVLVLVPEPLLQLVAFRTIQVVGRVPVINLLHGEGGAVVTYNGFGVVVDRSIVIFLQVQVVALFLKLQAELLCRLRLGGLMWVETWGVLLSCGSTCKGATRLRHV
jgi:hypothetical protein